MSATIISQTATQLLVEVPTGATTGALTITKASCGLDSSTNYTVINDNGCVGGAIPSGWSSLMFTGIYDDSDGSCHYIELFNPTGSAIDLSDYTIGLDNHNSLKLPTPTYLSPTVPLTGFSGGILSLSGSIASESTIMILV